ncbi:MAG: hypothetical protein U0Z75_09670 [Deinococcaceae bacterium]
MKNIYFGIVAAGLALLASSCGKTNSNVTPVMAAQSAGPVFYPSNNSEYADFLGAGVLQSFPTASSKLVPITIAPTSGASIESLKVSSSNPTVATVTAEGNKLGGNYWNFEVWPKSIGTTNLTLTATDSNGVESQVTLTYVVADKPSIMANVFRDHIFLSSGPLFGCVYRQYDFLIKVKYNGDVPTMSTDTSDSLVASISMSKVETDGISETYKVSVSSVKAGMANLSFEFSNAYGTTTKTIGVTRTC